MLMRRGKQLVFLVVTILMGINPIVASASYSRKSLRMALTFQSMPITYEIQQKSPYYTKMWREAINTWNKELKTKGQKSNVFVPVKKHQTPDITLSAVNKYNWSAKNVTGTTRRFFNRRGISHDQVRLNIKQVKKLHYSYQERRNVMVHELGHVIGLPHNNNYQSVMYYAARKQTIQREDINGAKWLINNKITY